MEQNQIVDTINLGINTALANMHTCTIAKVTAVNETTIDCKPVFNRLDKDQEIELPVFAEVPIINLQGGASYHAFPIIIGDYALLFFTERCFDGWYNGQDDVLPLEYRMHDYSDGFALVGINNLGGAITIPLVIQQTGDTNQDGDYTHQGKRTQEGDYDLTGNKIHDGDVDHTGDVVQIGNYDLTGLLTILGGISITGSDGGAANMNNINIIINTGNITLTSGDVVADGISLKNHTHPINSGSSAPGPTGAPQ